MNWLRFVFFYGVGGAAETDPDDDPSGHRETEK